MAWCWNCKIREYENDRCPLPGCGVLKQDDPQNVEKERPAPVRRGATKAKEKA